MDTQILSQFKSLLDLKKKKKHKQDIIYEN